MYVSIYVYMYVTMHVWHTELKYQITCTVDEGIDVSMYVCMYVCMYVYLPVHEVGKSAVHGVAAGLQGALDDHQVAVGRVQLLHARLCHTYMHAHNHTFIHGPSLRYSKNYKHTITYAIH